MITLPIALMWLAIGVAAVLAVAGIVAILLIEFGPRTVVMRTRRDKA